MASRQRARTPLRGQPRRRSRAPRRRWLEPRSAPGRARIGPRSARAPTERARVPWATPRAFRSEHEMPPEWRVGGKRNSRFADKRGGAAERRSGAGSSRRQQRSERESGRGTHEHRRNDHVRHGRHRVHCAASRSCHRHCEPAASESAAARTNAATQPSAEVTLARHAVGGEQSEGWFVESTNTDSRWHGRNQRCRVHCAASASSAGMASWRRARMPPRGRTQRRSRSPRRRWLEPRSAASRARGGSRRARAPTNAAWTPWAKPSALRSEHELPPAWRAGGERERRRADERGDAAER